MRKLLALAAFLAAAGCGATSNGARTASSPTPTPTPAVQFTTVHDIQTGVTPVGSVSLRGLVVTAVEPGNSGLHFYAQDPGGGPYSGIYFYDQHGKTPAELAVGDEVTVSGDYTEFNPPWSPWNSAVSEIVPAGVEITGSGLTPSVDKLPDVSALADVAGEPWEGCLVQLNAVTVKSVGANYGEYEITDPSGSYVRVDHQIFDSFEPRLLGEALADVTGVVDDSFDHYHLEPRSTEDVAGTADNQPVALSIRDLQDATSAVHPVQGQLVTLTDVVVSSLAPYTSGGGSTLTSFWTQTATVGTAYTGVYVHDLYWMNPQVHAGDTVTLTGKYIEAGGGTNVATEIVLFPDHAIGAPSATGATVEPLMLTLHELKTNSKKYEGLLVQLADPSVSVLDVNPDAPADYGEYKIGDATDDVRIGTLIGVDTRTGLSANDSLVLVRGMFHKEHGSWHIEPRAADDVSK